MIFTFSLLNTMKYIFYFTIYAIIFEEGSKNLATYSFILFLYL